MATLDLTVEATLAGADGWVVGMDEVGRGALAGPVSVGAVAVRLPDQVAGVPSRLRDSKQLRPQVRREVAEELPTWAPNWAVGHASAAEIDAFGIVGGLRLAGWRALAALTVPCPVVLLDGSHDWLTPPEEDLFGGLAAGSGIDSVVGLRPEPTLPNLPARPAVTCQVKADTSCASVAAASVFAKVSRDDLMVELSREFPEFGWAENKGYGAAEHLAALSRLGPCEQHRRSWKLPARSSESLT